MGTKRFSTNSRRSGSGGRSRGRRRSQSWCGHESRGGAAAKGSGAKAEAGATNPMDNPALNGSESGNTPNGTDANQNPPTTNGNQGTPGPIGGAAGQLNSGNSNYRRTASSDGPASRHRAKGIRRAHQLLKLRQIMGKLPTIVAPSRITRNPTAPFPIRLLPTGQFPIRISPMHSPVITQSTPRPRMGQPSEGPPTGVLRTALRLHWAHKAQVPQAQ